MLTKIAHLQPKFYQSCNILSFSKKKSEQSRGRLAQNNSNTMVHEPKKCWQLELNCESEDDRTVCPALSLSLSPGVPLAATFS